MNLNSHKIQNKSIPKIVIKHIVCFGLIFVLNSCSSIQLAQEAPFDNPPSSLAEIDLIGSWVTKYGGWAERTDKIVLGSGGKYKQTYIENGEYIFESQWNDWWIEVLPDGRQHLHLENGKYFLGGVAFSEKMEGMVLPCKENDSACEENPITITWPLYDWIGNEFIEYSSELILNIRVDSSNELILLHLWTSTDRGWAIFGGEVEIFRRVSLP